MNPLPKLIGFELRDQTWFVENLPLSKIAQQFGTPCYVYSHEALCAAFMAYEKACLRADGSRRARVHFAMKSNSNLAILQLFSQLGAGFDLVSGGELERVVASGADPSLCVFSGVGKSIAEIKRALELGVKCFNVESIPELTRINHIASEMGVIAPISLRVNPDVDAKTHPYISTGLKDNKFGIAYESVLNTYLAAKAMSHCKIIGIDCHIGSQILELQPYLDALDRIFLLIDQLREQGIDIKHLDVGGGLGIDYGGDVAPNITDFANHILQHIENSGFGYLDLIFEPGRSLVGNAGVLLTKIEYLKPTEAKNFCIVDAAMNDLMRPAMYEAFHHIVPVLLKPLPHQIYDIVGPVCETGDWLGKDRELAVEQDDLLMIMSAGAYGSSMSSNYNTRARSAEVMVVGDKTFLIKERESIQSLFAGEHLLPKK